VTVEAEAEAEAEADARVDMGRCDPIMTSTGSLRVSSKPAIEGAGRRGGRVSRVR
jgi:hypothetical protein